MDLQCHIEAFPSPSVLWLKDDYHLTDNQFYQISIFSTADEFTDSTLRIISIEKKQYGNYTCKAINKLGSDEQVVELYGMWPLCVTVMNLPSTTLRDTRFARFTCTCYTGAKKVYGGVLPIVSQYTR